MLNLFFSSWGAFCTLILRERPAALWGLLACIPMLVLCAALFIHAIKHEALSVERIGLILGILIAIAALAVQSWNHIDDVKMAAYEEAESLFQENHCQAAKELYWAIYAMDYRDCREKAASCDYRSASYYIGREEYKNAFELLFPHLSDNPLGTSPEMIERMWQLVESAIDGISSANKGNRMLNDPDLTLGKWADESAHYILFFMEDNKEKLRQNIRSDFPEYYHFANGVLSSSTKSGAVFWRDEFLFYPISEHQCYVYCFLNHRMYLLTRVHDVVR